MGNMRIAVASSGLGHVFRGIEGWAQDLAAALHARGEDVTLFKGAGEAEVPYEKVLRCLKRESRGALWIHKLLPKHLVWRLGLGTVYGIEQISFGLKLIRHLRRGKFDVLHVQDPQLAQLVQRAESLGLVQTKTILAHGTNEPVEFLQRIRYLQHLAPWHLEQTRNAGAWKPTWTAIPNFIDTCAYRPGRNDPLRDELGISRNALVILSVAAIKRQHKRIDYLLSEFAQLIERVPQAHLIVAGGAEADTPELIAIGRASLRGHFTPLVRFPRQRMSELYRCADLFVLCSVREMMPIALVEACASGLPCVVNDHPILRWIVGPVEDALIDMQKPQALANALAWLAANPQRRSHLGKLARMHCEKNFGEASVVSQILEYYHAVLDSRKPVPSDAASRIDPNALLSAACHRS
jgi:glycosyltransferase involved in cell wall biosynthesis